MTLTDLIPGLKHTASTNGGEWSGPCPFCGGRDRFRVWPDQGTTGKFWCRSCGKHGDGLQFLRDRDGLSYRDACASLGVMPSLSWKPGTPTRPTPTTWEPRQATTPGTTWQERAASFLAGCQRTLAGPAGSDCRAFLTGRGLRPETIERAGLGWNPGDQYESRESWGLEPKLSEKTGKPLKVWIPRGLIIPLIEGGHVHRLRVRRPNPKEDESRYILVSGSASTPLTLGEGTAWVIVESELDALLLAQEAGDVCGVLSMGNAQARPDEATDQTLRAASLLLIALDSDAAGAREAWGWWLKHYANAKRWPIPGGFKDPTEGARGGLSLRLWIKSGLPDEESKTQNKVIDFTEPDTTQAQEPAQSAPPARLKPLQTTIAPGEGIDQGSARRTVFEPFPAEWKTRYNEDQLERLAHLTVDGGLSDAEAERVLH